MSKIKTILSIIFIFTIWGCVSSACPILWWSRECVLHLIIIIKPEVWIINHCLGLGHETMVCAVCLTMFLWSLNMTLLIASLVNSRATLAIDLNVLMFRHIRQLFHWPCILLDGRNLGWRIILEIDVLYLSIWSFLSKPRDWLFKSSHRFEIWRAQVPFNLQWTVAPFYDEITHPFLKLRDGYPTDYNACNYLSLLGL